MGAGVSLVFAQPAEKNCEQTSTAKVPSVGIELMPLNDMGAEEDYKGENGGLYGNGENTIPVEHFAKAHEAVNLIQPLDWEGNPSEEGKIGFISIGMSNTRREFEEFQILATNDSMVNNRVSLINGAQGGVTAHFWATTEDPWTNLANLISDAGLSANQVQVVWLKQANANPTADDMGYASYLKSNLIYIAKRVKLEYPNVQIIFLSSRIYAGYATGKLNPEPYAYVSAFAVRGAIQDQISGNVTYEEAPPLVWGPYLWSNGILPRSDGLTWMCDEFAIDGTHPSEEAEVKVAEILLDFFKTNPLSSSWFASEVGLTPTETPVATPTPTTGEKPGDADADGLVNIVDYTIWFTNYGNELQGPENGDFDNGGYADGVDYVIWLTNYGK
jgi:hypothetical protein